MRWYVGYPILAAGLAFGFETLFPNEPGFSRSDRSGIQARASQEPEKAPTVVMASEIDALAPQQTSRLAAFSPGARLPTEVPAGNSVLDYLAQTLAPAPAAPEPVVLQPVTVSAWKSAVIRENRSAVPPTPARPDALTRIALARDIQRELQRVGCYLGEIDGVWGGGSKRALLIFMDRVNASLPTREPDVILLSLLRGQTDAVCGASCPQGQSLTAAGRCVPSTLMAQAGTVPGKAGGSSPAPNSDEAWGATVAEAGARGPEPYGRMSIGGPRPDDVAQLTAGWSRTTGEPSRAAQLARTAALELQAAEGTVAADGEQAPDVANSSFDSEIDAAPVKRRKATGIRAKSRARGTSRTSSYRHVQRLFTHPLGRM